MPIVLVTGGTGYVGTFCIIEALEKGYTVRTTIRDLERSVALRESILRTSSNISEETLETKLAFFSTDLTSDKGWEEAVTGCDYILHVASPFPISEPKNPNDVIGPAKEGVLRVLRTATKVGGVKKVVMTSSYAAIGYGYPNNTKVDESHWTQLENVGGAYVKSKTIAESAAWEYMQDNKPSYTLTAINPFLIMGPLVKGSTHISTSIDILKTLVSGIARMGCPKLSFGIADIRDVARLHVESLSNPDSDNERFLVLGKEQELSILDMSIILKNHLDREDKTDGKILSILPNRELPSFVIKLMALVLTSLRGAIPYLGKSTEVESTKAQKVFNWEPYTAEETILATYRGLKEEHII